jgi:predicted NodU family carbamoyl transferase
MISLGFNYPQMHDSSACTAHGKERLFGVGEERISRIKIDASFPDNAIWVRLEFAEVSPDELDFICQGWPAPGKVFATDLKCVTRGQYSITYLNALKSAWLLRWNERAEFDLCD